VLGGGRGRREEWVVKERGRKRGERMKGRGVWESGVGKRKEGREERMERKYDPRKKKP